MMKNATRKPRMIIVSGSARKTSMRPPISGRSAIAPAAAAPMRDCAHAVPIAPNATAIAAAKPSRPWASESSRGPAGAGSWAIAADATMSTTASAQITTRTFFNLVTSCFLERAVRVAGLIVVLELRQELHPVETSGLDDVTGQGEDEEHHLDENPDQCAD